MELAHEREKGMRLLAKLTEAHGAPGYENDVRRIFRDELCREIRTDRTGSVLCEKRGSADTPIIMLTSHMDEVGFVVQTVTKSGLIKFMPLGGWWAHTLLSQRVRIRTREGAEIIGVIGAKPPHFLETGEREKLMKIDEMFIDVGAESSEDVQNRFGISLGDSIVPESPFTPMHVSDLLLCKAFDNRVGTALTIHAIQLLDRVAHPNTVYGVGTVQEEVGTRGAQTAVFTVDPGIAIVLEGSPADDLPNVSEDERQGALGRGVQIRLMDPSAIMNQKLARYVIEAAKDNEIPHQVAVRKSGGTDAHVIHLHRTGVPTIVLGVPARYIHTHNGIISMQDYLSTLMLVLKLIEKLDESTVNGFTVFND